jgi:hypothetical protein
MKKKLQKYLINIWQDDNPPFNESKSEIMTMNLFQLISMWRITRYIVKNLKKENKNENV